MKSQHLQKLFSVVFAAFLLPRLSFVSEYFLKKTGTLPSYSLTRMKCEVGEALDCRTQITDMILDEAQHNSILFHQHKR